MGAPLHLGWLPDCKYSKKPRDSALTRWRKCWMPLFFVEIMFCTHNNVLWWNVRNIGCKAAYSRICKCCSSCFKQQISVVKLAILSPYRIINIKNVINVTFFIGKMCNLTWVRRKKSVKKVVGMEYFSNFIGDNQRVTNKYPFPWRLQI